MVLVMILALGATYLWQRAEVHDRQVALDRAAATADAVSVRASGLEATTEQLRGAVERLQGRVQSLTGRLQDVGASKQHLAAQLDALRAETTALLGTPLADGRYFGSLIAVGATQDPPRLVIDLEQFFSGDAADQAAREDGVLPPGQEHVDNDVYIRNESPQWRTLAVDPSATVALTSYPFGQVDGPLMVSIERFGHLLQTGRGSLIWFPYWITVRGAEVVAIEQQFIP
jgi:hypothetical protein